MVKLRNCLIIKKKIKSSRVIKLILNLMAAAHLKKVWIGTTNVCESTVGGSNKTVCEKLQLKVVEHIQNYVPQRKSGKIWSLQSTVHTVISSKDGQKSIPLTFGLSSRPALNTGLILQ